MINTQLALVQREVWEHRSIWVTPLALTAVVVLMAATGIVIGSSFKEVVDAAIVGASNVGDIERRALLIATLGGIAGIFALAMWILTVFYCLDSLYAERKDKSILFWRSLPITDTETVVSKLIVAVLVIPLAMFAGVVVTQLLNLIVGSIWISMEGGSPGHLLWDFAALADLWAATLILLLAMSLWLAPFIGWFLFVSAFAKRSPLLFAFLPIAIVPMLERVVFGSNLLAEAIFIRSFNVPIMGGLDLDSVFDEENIQLSPDMVSVLSAVDIGAFFSSFSLWAGVLVCALLTAAAVYVRRYRDES